MMKKLLVAVAVSAALGTAMSAQAGNIKFDRNGAIGGVATNVIFDSFDWNFGNILFDNLFPLIPVAGVRTDMTVLGQAKLSAFQPSGAPPLAGTEITYVFEAPSTAELLFSGAGISVVDHDVADLGSFTIYFDDFGASGVYAGGVASNDVTGLGYGDGHAILTGHFSASSPSGALIIDCSGTPEDLDGIGVNNAPGVKTCTVSGSMNYHLEIDSYDSDFFLDNVDLDDLVFDFDFTFTSDSSTPFENANPSDAVVGVTPVYGTGGPTGTLNGSALCPTSVDRCDLHVESDGRSPFVAEGVPEPATVALIGAGLLGFGAVRRSRRRSR